MQIGSRWGAGSRPHPAVAPELHEAIAAAEAMEPNASSWTLTWLEGRPQCDLDDRVQVVLEADGSVTTRRSGEVPDEDDDWLL